MGRDFIGTAVDTGLSDTGEVFDGVLATTGIISGDGSGFGDSVGGAVAAVVDFVADVDVSGSGAATIDGGWDGSTTFGMSTLSVFGVELPDGSTVEVGVVVQLLLGSTFDFVGVVSVLLADSTNDFLGVVLPEAFVVFGASTDLTTTGDGGVTAGEVAFNGLLFFRGVCLVRGEAAAAVPTFGGDTLVGEVNVVSIDRDDDDDDDVPVDEKEDDEVDPDEDDDVGGESRGDTVGSLAGDGVFGFVKVVCDFVGVGGGTGIDVGGGGSGASVAATVGITAGIVVICICFCGDGNAGLVNTAVVTATGLSWAAITLSFLSATTLSA